MIDGKEGGRLVVCGTTSRGNWCRRLEISSNKWYKVELEQRIEPEEVIKKMKDFKKKLQLNFTLFSLFMKSRLMELWH